MDAPKLRACHCDMCRKHTSGAFFSIETLADSITVTGPAKAYKSSEWAGRGFCEICGSTLWYETNHDGVRNLAAGLFANAGGGTMTAEFFADQCPTGYSFAGTHKKLTTQETIALFAPDEE
ncbi:Glutathione-dependent formaldehyde-activating enzyme-like protein [Sulfitobacter noctilucicola]|nr:Glutathione-dependent formaldehyde-activating enzyme-like protein [Sulfitobacter noctilucicola]